MTTTTRIVDFPFLYDVEAVMPRKRKPERATVCGMVQATLDVLPAEELHRIELPFGAFVPGCVHDGRLFVDDGALVITTGGLTEEFGLLAARMFDSSSAGGSHPASSIEFLKTFQRIQSPGVKHGLQTRTTTDDLRDIVFDGFEEARTAALQTASGYAFCGDRILTAHREPVMIPAGYKHGVRTFSAIVEDMRDPFENILHRYDTLDVASASEMDPHWKGMKHEIDGIRFRHDPMARSILHFLAMLDGYGQHLPTAFVGRDISALRRAALESVMGSRITADRMQLMSEKMMSVSTVLRDLETNHETRPMPAEAGKLVEHLKKNAAFRLEMLDPSGWTSDVFPGDLPRTVSGM
jgi:hypothetical protein